MDNKVKDNTDAKEVTDSFIKYNHENKALKLAYKKLKNEISEKLLEAHRKFFRHKHINRALLLGRKHCALLFMFMEGEGQPDYDVNIEDINFVDTSISEIKLWGMSIYVSIEDDYKIEIIGNLGSLDGEGDLHTEEDEPNDVGLYWKKPLINIDELIDNLPDNMKIKRIRRKNYDL